MDDLLAEFEAARTPTTADRARRRRLYTTVAIAGMSLVAIGSLTTGAVFTDSDSVDSATITSGTVDLSLAPATVNFTATNMAPGDTEFGTVTVQNDGSLQMRYAMSGSAAGVLGTELQVTVFGTATCNAAGVSALTPLATSGPIIPTRQLFGDPSQGADPGDRTVDSGDTDTLCVRIQLPLATDDTFQNTDATLTFDFDAEQTANN